MTIFFFSLEKDLNFQKIYALHGYLEKSKMANVRLPRHCVSIRVGGRVSCRPDLVQNARAFAQIALAGYSALK